MSNEPKWNILRDRDADGNKEYILTNKTEKFFFEENPPPFGLMRLLNRLESENAELRERLLEAEVGLKLSEAARIAKYERTPEDEEFCRKYLADKSTTPRTDDNREHPILIKAGDKRVLINGYPCKVDFRIVAEDYYQKLLTTPCTDTDGWISVQDRLPEHGKYVLSHYYETPLLKMISTWKYNKDNPHWTNGTFTHWMPLPEPPHQFRTTHPAPEGGEG